MDLERKHSQRSLELSRRFFGPDRAEVAKGSNDVGPQVNDAIHGSLLCAEAMATSGGIFYSTRALILLERHTNTQRRDELAEDAPADAGVYEARKSVKKIRAILRLLRQPLAMSARVVRVVGHGLRTRERQAKAEVPPLVRRAKAALLVSCQSVPVHIERAGGFRAARGLAPTRSGDWKCGSARITIWRRCVHSSWTGTIALAMPRAGRLGARAFAPSPKAFKASVTHWWRDR
jgi:hypothetical protein